MAELRDEVVLGLFGAAMAAVEGESGGGLEERVALVAHGGYGRRQLAPFSDVDVMLLRAAGDARPVARLAERLLCDVFDAGLILGHSVRTPEEAARLACLDATIGTSLFEARLLAGSRPLFEAFVKRLEGRIRRRCLALLAAIEQARTEERLKFGETVYLLEPNVKRSRGGLRDLGMLRWIGMVRYGTPRPEELHRQGLLSAEDLDVTGQAAEFLLRLRNEMHFHAGRASDVLDRWEQLRIAERRQYVPEAGLLAVEQFMRDYFRHADQVSHVVGRFVEKARSAGRGRVWASLVGRRVSGGFVVGPRHLVAGRRALDRMRGSLAAIL
jgi:[protein-PII] uridylyltransferase